MGEYIVVLCAVALLSTCADMMLPKGGLKDSVRFAFSLIFIAALLAPIAAMLV